ncbi:unnamed protein product [Arctogadus glacialis]
MHTSSAFTTPAWFKQPLNPDPKLTNGWCAFDQQQHAGLNWCSADVLQVTFCRCSADVLQVFCRCSADVLQVTFCRCSADVLQAKLAMKKHFSLHVYPPSWLWMDMLLRRWAVMTRDGAAAPRCGAAAVITHILPAAATAPQHAARPVISSLGAASSPSPCR